MAHERTNERAKELITISFFGVLRNVKSAGAFLLFKGPMFSSTRIKELFANLGIICVSHESKEASKCRYAAVLYQIKSLARSKIAFVEKQRKGLKFSEPSSSLTCNVKMVQE